MAMVADVAAAPCPSVPDDSFAFIDSGASTCPAAPGVRWANASAVFDCGFLGDAATQIDCGAGASCIDLCRTAAGVWNGDLSGRFSFVEAAGPATFCDTADGVSSIGGTTHLCDGTSFGGNVLAATLSIFFSSGPQKGQLIDANITVNQAFSFSQLGFQSTVAHELGHVLGLSHPDQCGKDFNVLMRSASLFTPASPCFVLDPTAADLNGAKLIYASSNATPSATPPVGATPVPTATTLPALFVKSVRSCQATLAAQSQKYATALHRALDKCLDRILKDVAEHGAPVVPHPCNRTLDANASKSAMARARTAAIAHVIAKCGSVSPADLDHPCDAGATTIAQVADCVVTQHAGHVEAMVAAEYADACALLQLVGLAGQYPLVCP